MSYHYYLSISLTCSYLVVRFGINLFLGVNCGDPPQVIGTGPTRPISSSSNNRFPSVVQYSCVTGYELVGSSFISCLSNGSWSSSEVTAQCRGKLLTNYCHWPCSRFA